MCEVVDLGSLSIIHAILLLIAVSISSTPTKLAVKHCHIVFLMLITVSQGADRQILTTLSGVVM